MSIYINGHGLYITTGTNGVRLAECNCGAKIHKRMPNHKHQNITLKEFMHEANVIHQQHLHNIIDREQLKALLNTKYGKNAKYPETNIIIKTPTTYQETDSMSEVIKPCKLNYSNQDEHRLQGGAHNYMSFNETTIYCTQCGDVQLIGGVVEDENMDNHQANSDLRTELEESNKDKSYFHTLSVERGKEILELHAELDFWKSWYKAGAPRSRIEHYLEGCLDIFHNRKNGTDSKTQAHAIIESIRGMLEREDN